MSQYAYEANRISWHCAASSRTHISNNLTARRVQHFFPFFLPFFFISADPGWNLSANCRLSRRRSYKAIISNEGNNVAFPQRSVARSVQRGKAKWIQFERKNEITTHASSWSRRLCYVLPRAVFVQLRIEHNLFARGNVLNFNVRLHRRFQKRRIHSSV